LRRSLTTVAAAVICAASMAAAATPANAATARPNGIITSLWGYFADLPTCYHQGVILAAENSNWIGYYCQVDPTRSGTNVGLWYEVVG
jgi:hypothetical protein